jgi:immunity protein Imm1 of predicted polymorphic toxin system
MSQHIEHAERLVLTASLTTGVVRVAHGMRASAALVDEIMTLDHTNWETILMVGDVEYHQTAKGPYPDNQMRVSVRPSVDYAALSYTANNDPAMSIANSYNPRRPLAGIYLIFSGDTGAVFPQAAAIPIADARNALKEWLRTRLRPTCIEWRPFDGY